MSLETHRTLIADALRVVPDVHPHERFTANTAPGTSYPRMDRVRYPNRLGGVVEWNVVVVLPQDPAEAERWIETHLDDLRDALAKPHGPLAISSIEPRRLDTGAGILPALFINGHRAEQD